MEATVEELRRALAALLCCAFAAIWLAAGFVPACASLLAAAAAYASVALSQRRAQLRPDARVRAPRRRGPVRAAKPATSRRGRVNPPPRSSRSHGWPAFELDELDEADRAALSAAGPYGW